MTLIRSMYFPPSPQHRCYFYTWLVLVNRTKLCKDGHKMTIETCTLQNYACNPSPKRSLTQYHHQSEDRIMESFAKMHELSFINLRTGMSSIRQQQDPCSLFKENCRFHNCLTKAQTFLPNVQKEGGGRGGAKAF